MKRLVDNEEINVILYLKNFMEINQEVERKDITE